MASLTEGTKTSTFIDGPDGERWIRQTPTETVAYLDGQEAHLPAGATSASAATGVRYYSHGGDTVAVRKTGTGAGLAWMLGDRQGSASISVNGSTGAITRDRYLPYGGNRNTGGAWTLPTDRGWLGQTQDKDTGLDYLNARYYDPTLAHFISTDPLNDQTTPATPTPTPTPATARPPTATPPDSPATTPSRRARTGTPSPRCPASPWTNCEPSTADASAPWPSARESTSPHPEPSHPASRPASAPAPAK